ncbi:MAG TPA: carbohydrate kinase family protein, partial [Candidatus Limnocylindria bacterium]|nr:carbohydrate kinase family protein [Candidatus Limnocylindria bacterium]
MDRGITCAGNLIVDQVKEIEAYPQPGNLTTIKAVSRTVGGLVPNCLLALRALDPVLPLEAVGLVGNDEPGDWL